MKNMGRAVDKDMSYKIGLGLLYTIWDKVCGKWSGERRFAFTPDLVVERYEQTFKNTLCRVGVDNWIAFENCEIDWDAGDFESRVLQSVDGGVELFIVTDDGLLGSVAFRFVRGQFGDFAAWYEDEYKMGFFQAADYIIFDATLSFLRVLTHEGMMFTTSISDSGLDR